jgi:hypothetical protein
MNSLAGNNVGNLKRALRPHTDELSVQNVLHPSWQAFIEYCLEMNHGEIERLKIQDGFPVLAELTTKKVKFTR